MIKKVQKEWGYEKWIVNTEKYCGKLLYLKKGKRCSLHHHAFKDETFYVLNGKVIMEIGIIIDMKEKIMVAGDSQRIKPNTDHRFNGLEESAIIEFSTHHEDGDSYRMVGQLSGDVPQDIMEKYSK